MSQTQNQITWESILKTNKIEFAHIDFAINNLEQAPILPYELVYKFADKVYYPSTVAISGSGGVVGAILVLKYSNNVKYFVTTEDVVNAQPNSPLFISRYALEKLSKKIKADIIELKLGEFEKIKMLIKAGGIYVSGLPYELVIQISQLAGFGKLWHFSNIHKKFYVF